MSAPAARHSTTRSGRNSSISTLRQADSRPADACAHPVPGDSTGLARCLDLPRLTVTFRPPAATPEDASSTAIIRAGARCATRRNTGADRLGRCPARRIRAPRERDLRATRPAARKGARHRGAAAGDDAHPRRQRGVRAQQRLLRSDHAARPPGPDRRLAVSIRLSRQERRRTRDRRSTIPRSRASCDACRDLPGQELFHYVDDDGAARDDRLRRRERLPPRDRRRGFHRQGFPHLGRHRAGRPRRCRNSRRFDSAAQAKRNIVQAVESVAEKLGNTCAVCRKCYIHPAVLDAYLDGTLLKVLKPRRDGN